MDDGDDINFYAFKVSCCTGKASTLSLLTKLWSEIGFKIALPKVSLLSPRESFFNCLCFSEKYC